MGRLPYITCENLDEAQQTLFDHITKGKRTEGKSGKDYMTPEGGLRGPFNAWLYAPEMGEAVQRLGVVLRFESSLSPILRELAILTVAARWRCQYEWWAHEQIAKKVGLQEGIMACIKKGKPPKPHDPMQSVVYEFSRELLETRGVSDETYRKAVELLGETAVVELVTLIGYYMLVSANLNVFKVPIPPGEKLPFDE